MRFSPTTGFQSTVRGSIRVAVSYAVTKEKTRASRYYKKNFLQGYQETNEGNEIILPFVRLYQRKLQEDLRSNKTIKTNIAMYQCSINEI